MLLFGRSRSRRGLASALIGEVAAVIEGIEGFEEVRKLEDMEIGAEGHSQFTNPMRTDSIYSMQQFSDGLPIFTRLPEALPGICTHSRRPKKNPPSCASSTRLTRKRKSTGFLNWATTCYVICEGLYPKSSQ
jgi:hypothetical protein